MACSPFFICNNYYKKYIKDSYNLKKYFKCASRVPTGQEKSGKFVFSSRSGKSQGILKNGQ